MYIEFTVIIYKALHDKFHLLNLIQEIFEYGKIPYNSLVFSPMFTVTRLYRLTDYKESSPEGLSMQNMLPPSRLNLVTSWVLYFSPFSVPILLAGIQKQCQCKMSCSKTKYSSYFCKAVTHSESDQARRCLPSLTRLNAHTRSTPLYH